MKETIKQLRRRLQRSESLNNSLAWLLCRYIRFAYESSDWERHGFDELNELALAGEAVIVALWHQRLLMTPYYFPLDLGEAGTVTSASPAGSVAARVHLRFGLKNVLMEDGANGFAASRAIAKLLREGVTMGFAADGPLGPERLVSVPLIHWARMSGRRVFIISYSVRDAMVSKSWDRLLLPRPYTKGVFVCREWKEQIPRRATAEEVEFYRKRLEAELDAVTAESDALVRRNYAPPGPT